MRYVLPTQTTGTKEFWKSRRVLPEQEAAVFWEGTEENNNWCQHDTSMFHTET